jgi:hypothetical protein
MSSFKEEVVGSNPIRATDNSVGRVGYHCRKHRLLGLDKPPQLKWINHDAFDATQERRELCDIRRDSLMVWRSSSSASRRWKLSTAPGRNAHRQTLIPSHQGRSSDSTTS